MRLRRPSFRRSALLVAPLAALALPLAAIPSGGVAASSASAADRSAELVLHNGKIVTVDAGMTVTQAVAIRDGRFLAVGTDQDVLATAGPVTRVIDLRGRTVIPGLIDSHLHQLGAALNATRVSLLDARSIADVVEAIAQRVAETPAGQWVMASSAWHESLLNEGRLPTRADLDPVSPDHPVFIPRGGHVITVNSAALAIAGITAETPDPEGGVIVRDAGGEPTGVLLESATELVEEHLPPPPPPQEQARLLTEYMAELNSFGITGVTEPGLSDAQIALYQSLWRNQEMTVRTHMLYGVRTGGLEATQHAVDTYTPRSGDDMLALDGLKFSADGGVEGARLYEPYQIVEGEQTDADYRGVLLLPDGGRDELVAAYRLAAEHGFQVQTHAVGDETIDLVVDAYAQVNADIPVAPQRWTVMHVFLPTEQALAQMAQMDVLATAQDHPTLLGANQLRWWGDPRAAYAIPIRSLIDHGILVGGGTDAPVLPANPFLSMWWMVTRDTLTSGTLGPSQAISREEALQLYTRNSAYTQFAEDTQGSIEVGKLADLVVLSDDLLTVPGERIGDVQALMTVLGGEIVHERIQRRAGADRTATAAAVSSATFAPGAPVAYVATQGNFPDTLAGGPAAAKDAGPVLLVSPDAVPAATAAELERLAPQRIVVLGGPTAVSQRVEADLATYTGGDVQRLAGGDRYATAAAVSAASFQPGVEVAYVATGENFPDALAGGAAAAADAAPMLLASGDALPAATEAELRRLQPDRIVVLGGNEAVSQGVEQQLASVAPVERVAGATRYETAARVADRFTAGDVDQVYVATGEAFPDALTAVPAAAASGSPILLVSSQEVPQPVAAQLAELDPRVLVVLGGEAAVPTTVADRLVGLAIPDLTPPE